MTNYKKMDKGAHFSRCDFQVHTPRDPAWSGPRPLSGEERLQYGHKFIAACREKDLDAVAITDHHDMVMVPFIRRAAHEETDESGDPIPEDQQIRVFPGIELTLNVPCQALLILDSDFPEALFPVVLTALSIDPIDESKKEADHPEALKQFKSFEELYDMLDLQKSLRGKYIVLPHVKSGGHKTLLRRGSHQKYASMPCVGGYVDGTIECFDEGDRNKVDGKDKSWGNKKIAVLQTSDTRTSDHAKLGKYSTWIKWAVPTAEAIRQACLAPESRISHEPPVLPQTVIRSIRVSNSSFMGRIDLFLNPQYNALIGGRGTGKSTILEYLRWAVADQHPQTGEEDDTPNYKVRSRKLIEGTLRPHGGTIDVAFEINGIPHHIRRRSDTNEIMVKIGDGEFETCSEKEVRTLVPIQAYSQKQLSNVAVRLEELSNFVNAPIRDRLENVDKSFDQLVSETRQQYALVERKRSLERVIAIDGLSLKSLLNQTESIRKSLTGLTDKDRECLDKKTYYDDASHTVENWDDDVESARQYIQELRESLEELPSDSEVAQDGPLTENVGAIENQVKSLFDKVGSDLEQVERAIAEFDLPGSKYEKARSSLKREIERFEGQYNEAKARSTAHESKLQELKELEGRQRILRKAISKNKNDLASLGDPGSAYAKLRTAWIEQHRVRSNLVEEECERLTERSGEDIRATLQKGVGLGSIIEKLRRSLSGSNLRKQKFDSLLYSVSQVDDPVARWEEVLEELESLAADEPTEETSYKLPETPVLLQCDITNGDVRKIRDYLSLESWLEIALTNLQDQPIFEFRKRDKDYIEFENASAGQQATALLKTLLNQPGPPLIIDQPEDDLDNPVILDVVEQIWAAKSQRQLVFASHNANLVVNGDAELVVCCDHVVIGDRSGGEVQNEGAIDMPIICDAIKRIMEGGELAFKLRRDKYGF